MTGISTKFQSDIFSLIWLVIRYFCLRQMEGKRRFSERIAARQAALTNLSEKHGDELDEVNEPIIKRRALKKNHRKTTLSDGDKVFHGAAKVSKFLVRIFPYQTYFPHVR